MTVYDDPNREAVGLAPIWSGVSPEPKDGGDGLDAMTKADLAALAEERGVEVTADMTKAQIVDAIRAAGG